MSNESITTELLAALNIVVLENLDDNLYKIIGAIPDWFIPFYPDAALNRYGLIPEEKFLFLENFLIDAEGFWQGNDPGPLKSGVWSEIDALGHEYHLEASVVKIQDRKILLIELLNIDYKEKHLLIQKGRENNLNYYRLVKEIQNKQILIHCVVHDLAAEIAAVSYCLQLLEFQDLTPKGKEYIQISKKQSIKQEMLIQEILDAFSPEAEALGDFTLAPAQFPDALACTREVIDALLPTFTCNKKTLRLAVSVDIAKNWQVVGEKLRLERVLFNLIENASRYSPCNSTVTVALEEDRDFILLTVDDEGTGVPEDISKTLFQKFSQGKEKTGRAGLGLYFCRITVEHWGGTIGYSARPEGGSRFWVRLPKPV